MGKTFQVRLLPFRSVESEAKISRDGRDQPVGGERDIEIHQLCRDTSLALRELRDVIEYVLLDTLDMIDIDAWTLANLMEVSPSVIRALRRCETAGNSTERLIEILEKLQSQLQSACGT